MAEAVSLALRLPGVRRITVIGPVRPPRRRRAPWWKRTGTIPFRACSAAGSEIEEPPPPRRPGSYHRARGPWGKITWPLSGGTSTSARSQPHQAHLHKYSPLPGGVLGKLACLRSSGRRTIGRILRRGVRRPSHRLLHVRLQRAPARPAGATDLLLSGLLGEAHERGHTRMNLGLGVNEGVGFFKRKWGAVPFLPYVQTTWEITSPGISSILAGLFSRRS